MIAGAGPQQGFDLDTLPGRAILAAGARARLPAETAALGLERILVVTGGAAAPAGQQIAAALGARCAGVVGEVRQHVPEDLARAAVDEARARHADAVLTVGGGSATGLGKAVVMDIGVPLVAVPTTYAGSEMTPVYGITGTVKRTGRDPAALPRLVVYDPELTLALPARVTAASGLNAIAHAVAGLATPERGPLVAAAATGAITRLTAALPRCVEAPDDLAARTSALAGAYLAGWVLAHAGTGLQHRLAHVLGGDLRLVHADVHAALLPYTTALLQAGPAGAALRQAFDAADPAVALAALARRLGAPASLADLGVPREALAGIAERIPDAGVDLPALLEAAWGGTQPSRPTQPRPS